MQRINKVVLGLVIGLVVILSLSLNNRGAKSEMEQQPLYGGLIPTQTNELSQVKQGKALRFPADHQPHPNYAIEWWYFTANLSSETGASYALQYTLFRFNQGNKQANAWANGQMFMAHASLHTPEKHFFAERFARGGQEHVGVSSSPLSIRMDEWLWQSRDNNLLPATLSLTVTSNTVDSYKNDILPTKVQIDLRLNSTGPLVLQGDQGFSQKSILGTHASYYYSLPFIQADGTITEEVGKGKQSENVSGNGWFDHEWTSQLLDQQTLGWDWFSIHLDNGTKLMAFRMRLKDSQDFVTGTLINADGTTSTLPQHSLQLQPLGYEQDKIKDKQYPVQWSLSVPQYDIELMISPQKQQQWNEGRFQYYEGAINIKGTHTGRGFMELTGY